MTPILYSYAIFGTIFGGAGLYALYRSWQQRTKANWLVWAGWLCILIGLIFWGHFGGKDRGVILGIMAVMLMALAYVGYSAWGDKPDGRVRKPAKIRAPQPKQKKSWKTGLRRFGNFLFVVPVCACVSLAVALGIHSLVIITGGHAANALVLELFLFPIIWASLGVFVFISKRKVFKAITLIVMTIISLALIWLGRGA